MKLAPMQYKDYTWPHNPEIYSVTWQRKIAVQKIPFGRYCMQEMGPSYRVMRGKGTFAGPHAYQEFKNLVEVFSQDGAGLLIHPVWQASNAYFVLLQLTEEPLPDFVRYTFEFWEDSGQSMGLTAVSDEESRVKSSKKHSTEAKVWYTVKKGDTMWGISRKYGVTLQSLMAANPQIKNPNLIYVGNQVRVK